MNRTGSPRHPHPQSWTTHSHPDSLTSLYLTAISQTPWAQASRMTGAGQEATAQWLASYGVTFSRSHNHTATKCHLTLPLTKTQNPKALSTSSLHWFEHLYAANMEKKKEKLYLWTSRLCASASSSNERAQARWRFFLKLWQKSFEWRRLSI